jgi:hypothetical protein
MVLRALQSRSIETTGAEFTVKQLHFEADSFKTNLSLKSTHCKGIVLPNAFPLQNLSRLHQRLKVIEGRALNPRN